MATPTFAQNMPVLADAGKAANHQSVKTPAAAPASSGGTTKPANYCVVG